MKTIYKIILILAPIVLILSFTLKLYRPKYQQGQVLASMVKSRIDLPIREMFNLAHPDNQYPVAKTDQGFVLSGPYESLYRGNYTFNLEINPACQNESIGYIDIVSRQGAKNFGRKDITAVSAGQSQIVSLSADLETGADYEFRLYSNGNCAFSIEKGWLGKRS